MVYFVFKSTIEVSKKFVPTGFLSFYHCPYCYINLCEEILESQEKPTAKIVESFPTQLLKTIAAGTGHSAANCPQMTTTLVIKNSTSGAARLSSHMDWAGFRPAPRQIPAGSEQTFVHAADNRGSRGAVVYEVTNGYRWLVAWANQLYVDNQVYTKILNVGEKINWDDVSSQLDQATNASNDTNGVGFSTAVRIDQTSGSPTVQAELKHNLP